MSGTAAALKRKAAMPHRTKQKFVCDTLRGAILRCELRPGQRLVIDELARQLEVSAIPVREALQTLASEGLVSNVPHVGATVSPISIESIDEVFALMECLELVATRQAAQRMTDADAGELEAITSAMDAAVREGRNEDWGELNSRFHLAISQLSAMPMLHEMTARVLARWDRVRRYYFSGVLAHRIEQAQEEHRDLVRRMRTGDFVGLEEAVKQHNQGARLAYAAYLQANSA